MKSALTINQANYILDIVIGAGNFQLPRPVDEDAVIKAASEVLQQAESARRAGVSTTAVREVIEVGSNPLFMSELDILPEIFDNKGTEPAATDDPPLNNDSSEGTAAISTDAKQLERDQEQEPSHIELPTLPRDFSKVGDLELRSLHAERHSVLSKVIHELGLEESDYKSAQLNYETEYKRSMLGIDGKVTEKRDGAFLVPTVLDWREKIDQHHKKVIVLRSYKELLESEIRGLSREFTMRTGERTATP